MFYVRNIIGDKLGIVDTSDGVCEYYSDNEIKSFGVKIADSISKEDISSLDYKMNKKLYYMCSKGEESEFFSKYCIPTFDCKIGKSSRILGVYKRFDYADRFGLQVLILDLETIKGNAKGLYVVREDGESWSGILEGSDWRTSFYPCGSGYLYNLLFKRNLGLDLNLDENILFMLFYNLAGKTPNL